MAKTGIFGHDSSDGRPYTARIEKRCGKAYGSSGENIGSDFKIQGRDHALQTVMGLIIDDGVSSRGHRKNIFSTDFKYIGLASRVQGDKIITVIDFHSNELKTISKQPNNSNTGSKIAYDEPEGSQPQEAPQGGKYTLTYVESKVIGNTGEISEASARISSAATAASVHYK
jgi:hypothetical protein